MLLGSITIFLGILVLAAAYCFVTLKGLEVRNVFTDGSKHMAQYPIGVFNKGFRFIFTFLIPFALINYYPLLFILDKINNKGVILLPLITFIYLIPSFIIFYKGVKKYTSTGS